MANAMGVDEQLAVGGSRTSDNGQYRLDMQSDGNLVLYRTSDNSPMWASQTAGSGGTRAVMQSDGNLVIYGDAGAVWASQTSGHPGATLTVQDDGNVVIYESGSPLWATDTATAATGAAAGSVVSDTSAATAPETTAAGSATATATVEGTVEGSGLDRVYITKADDTLEAIAAYFYGDPVHRQRLIDDNPELATQSGPLPAGMRLKVSEDPNRGDAVSA